VNQEALMRIQTFSAAVGAGAVLALAAAFPAAQAYEVDASHQSTGAMSAQTLNALEARYKAQALMAQYKAELASHKAITARAQAAHVLKTSGWYSEATYYG
jgi:hypothetical protein